MNLSQRRSIKPLKRLPNHVFDGKKCLLYTGSVICFLGEPSTLCAQWWSPETGPREASNEDFIPGWKFPFLWANLSSESSSFPSLWTPTSLTRVDWENKSLISCHNVLTCEEFWVLMSDTYIFMILISSFSAWRNVIISDVTSLESLQCVLGLQKGRDWTGSCSHNHTWASRINKGPPVCAWEEVSQINKQSWWREMWLWKWLCLIFYFKWQNSHYMHLFYDINIWTLWIYMSFHI